MNTISVELDARRKRTRLELAAEFADLFPEVFDDLPGRVVGRSSHGWRLLAAESCRLWALQVGEEGGLAGGVAGGRLLLLLLLLLLPSLFVAQLP